MFHYLKALGYDNDWYAFDVFPKEIDTIKTFNAVAVLTRKLEEISNRIDSEKMKRLLDNRDPTDTIPYLYSLL